MKRIAGGFTVAIGLGLMMRLRDVVQGFFINCGILNCWPF